MAGFVTSLLAITGASPTGAAVDDGPLDPTFGTGGKVITAVSTKPQHLDSLTDLLLQPDGKIVAAGTTELTTSIDFALVRYNVDGSLDTTFDTDGKVTTDIGSFYDSVSQVLRQADGKLVAVGRFNGLSSGDVAAVRYNANGSIDSTYGVAGITITDIGATTHDITTGGVIQPDGKVVVVGTTAATLSSSANEIFALRYDTDGMLDPTFGTGGIVTTTVSAGMHYFGSAALQDDGKIVVVGSSGGIGASRVITAVRYDDDGTLDASFDGDGIVTTTFADGPGAAAGVVVQADDKIVVGGFVGSGFTQFALARYNPDGSLDTAFSGDGMIVVPGNGRRVSSLALDGEGRIIAAGTASSVSRSSSTDFMVERFTTDGSLDASFATGGLARAAMVDRSSFDGASAVVVQADGRIVAGGSTAEGSADSQFALVRFDPGYRGLTSTAPTRVLDSRAGGAARLPGGTVTRVATGAPAGTPSVLANLTMSDAELPGYITADKCSLLVAGAQTKSNGNYSVGQNIANSAVVNVDPDGAFCIYNEQPVHVLVDVQGYFGNGGNRLTTTAPTRALDTRNGPRRPAGAITRVETGVAAGTVSVLANLTMTDAELPGYITADKCSLLVAGPQTKSNGNYAVGQNIANTSVVNVDTDGAFCIYNEQPVHLLVDVQGTYRPMIGLDITTVTPSRVLNTRLTARPTAGTITRVNTGVPAGTAAVLVNLTMTDALLPGYITADKCSVLVAGPQTKSNGNFAPGSTIANSAVVNVDTDGAFCIYNEQPVHLLADIQATYR